MFNVDDYHAGLTAAEGLSVIESTVEQAAQAQELFKAHADSLGWVSGFLDGWSI